MARKTEISNRDLRSFAWIMAAFFIGVFGTGIPLLKHHSIRPWPVFIGLYFLIVGTLFPRSLRPIHFAWMKLGHALGWVNSRIILGVFYYLVVVPTAWILRLKGWDPMERRVDKKRVSYRVARQYDDVNSLQSMERPY